MIDIILAGISVSATLLSVAISILSAVMTIKKDSAIEKPQEKPFLKLKKQSVTGNMNSINSIQDGSEISNVVNGNNKIEVNESDIEELITALTKLSSKNEGNK